MKAVLFLQVAFEILYLSEDIKLLSTWELGNDLSFLIPHHSCFFFLFLGLVGRSCFCCELRKNGKRGKWSTLLKPVGRPVFKAGGIKGRLLGILPLDRRIKGGRTACRSVCFFHPLTLILGFRRSEIIWLWSRRWRKNSNLSERLLSLLCGQTARSDTVREDDSSEMSLSTAFPLGPTVLPAFYPPHFLIVLQKMSLVSSLWPGMEMCIFSTG